MSIDLEKNRESILKVYNDTLDDKTSTNWALFGYEGQTNILKVVGYGDGGLEELADDLNASKIMYAVVRVTDLKAQRTKIILIIWRGEGAPNIRKGICSRHLPDVKKLLKGVHITVSARTEEDIDNALIVDALAKATSADFNFADRSETPDPNVPVKNLVTQFRTGETCGAAKSFCPHTASALSLYPIPCPHCMVLGANRSNGVLANILGTNYKRVNAQSEINSNERNKFWEEQETEEKVRKEMEMKRREEDAHTLEKQRVEREVQDCKHREKINQERNAKIVAEKKAESVALERMNRREVGIWEKEKESQYSEEIERGKRADLMRQERKKEAENLIGRTTNAARSVFETQMHPSPSNDSYGRSHPPPKVLREFHPSNEDSRNNSKENSTAKRSIGSRWPPPSSEPETVPQPVVARGKIADWRPLEFQKGVDSGQSNKSGKPENNVTTNKLHHPVAKGTAEESKSITSQLGTCTSQLAEKTAIYSSKSEVHTSSKPSNSESHPSYCTKSANHTSSARTEVLSPSYSLSSGMPSSTYSSSGLIQSTPAVTLNTTSSITSTKTSYISEQLNGIENGKHTNIEGPRYANLDLDGPRYANVDDRTCTNGLIDDLGNPAVAMHDEQMPNNEDIDSFSMLYEVDGVEYQILPEHGLCARALYDYQAADETEITFDPGDIITNIDQIDVGWWQGVSSLGVFGLFPANYVELINGTKNYHD